MRVWSKVVAAGVGGLFLAASAGYAGTIHACKKKVGGTIRVVGAKTVCLATETKISWPDKAEAAAIRSQLAALRAQVAALQDLLQHFSRNGDEVAITGANLWIKSGSGITDGPVNGLGNLIVGYNATRPIDNVRTGSHNLVIGDQQNYSSYGGLVVGSGNTISNAYASVSGGSNNIASGGCASVSGGFSNVAAEGWASVSGGTGNTAGGGFSSVSGGASNVASGGFSSVSGGSGNTASGGWSSVSGGIGHAAAGDFDWRAGSLFEEQ